MLSSSGIARGSEALSISSAVNIITVDLLDGGDTITMDNITSLYRTSLIINGGNGNDQYVFVPSSLSGLSDLTPSSSVITIVDNPSESNTIPLNLGNVFQTNIH
jgi:hypothetical protein